MFLKLSIFTYGLSSLLPLIETDFWWIRILDFPRLQFFFAGLFFGIYYLIRCKKNKKISRVLVVYLSFSLVVDLYRILPYTWFWPEETSTAKLNSKSTVIKVITVNVHQDNTSYEKFVSTLREKSPDIFLVLEANKKWIEELAVFEKEYEFQIKQPQDNKYGMALYSKFPLEESKVRFLVEKGIPSIYTRLVLPSGDRISFYGVHPRPPIDKAGPTTERDAELLLVALESRNSTLPTVVFGDFNDVSWSHTTRRFRHISGLFDPRVGRGVFPTFPVGLPFLRFPLDYIFHSDKFSLLNIERLDEMGSDHFPILVSLVLDSDDEAKPTLNDD